MQNKECWIKLSFEVKTPLKKLRNPVLIIEETRMFTAWVDNLQLTRKRSDSRDRIGRSVQPKEIDSAELEKKSISTKLTSEPNCHNCKKTAHYATKYIERSDYRQQCWYCGKLDIARRAATPTLPGKRVEMYRLMKTTGSSISRHHVWADSSWRCYHYTQRFAKGTHQYDEIIFPKCYK